MRRVNSYVRSIVCFILIHALLSCSVETAAAFSLRSAATVAYEKQERQDISNVAYNKLLQVFTEDGRYQLEEHYPDYYGGAYIGETGELIVLVKLPSEKDLLEIKSACSTANYEIVPVKYSFNELLLAKNKVEQNWIRSLDAGICEGELVSISIRDNCNKVFIGVTNCNDEELRHILTKGIIPDMVEFFKTEQLNEMNTYYPGDVVCAYSQGTAGYKVRCNDNGTERIGFLTAAHVTNGENAYPNWVYLNKMGNTIKEKNSGSVDVAFVELASNHSFVNTINTTPITTGVSIIPAINSTVYKFGFTTYVTSGTVISNVNTTVWGTKTFTNLCETTTTCNNGDSGAAMYTKSGTNGQTIKAVGIVKGGNASYFYATKHSLIPWDLSIIS